ncbi:uncharacterized protein LOC123291641 [Chrysoperla carnea]|uniref:uncharacterized protein LOC123291641 n=1 Tax=Chrysoperla carnea TaxID=189513 RepID=UPI001D090288|nr:uncharacterized protein LOC123291641 [Chrysoperla carnea]
MNSENSELILTKNEKLSLDELLHEKGLSNYDVIIEAGSQKGDNFMGKIARIIIKTTTTPELKLILKCSIRNGEFRTIFPHNRMFQREIFMYTKYLPELYKIQCTNQLQNGLMPVPHVHKYSWKDCNEFILMDDMKHHGYEMLDRRKYLNMDHCKLVLHQLAHFHGLGFVMKHTQPQLFEKWSSDKQTNMIASNLLRNTSYEQKLMEMFTRASLALDPFTDEDILRKFLAYKNSMLKNLMDLEDPEQKDNYCVFVHNDCWINNLLFQYENSSKIIPKKLCLIDWQISNINSPIKDVSYFLYQSTDPNLLTENFSKLMDYYYEQLTECIEKCHLSIETVYPYDIFEKHLKRYMRHGVHYMIITGALHLSNEDEIPNHTMNMDKDRFTEDTLNIRSKNDQLYNLRIRGVIKHAILNNFL